MKRMISVWLTLAVLLLGCMTQPVSALSLHFEDSSDCFSFADVVGSYISWEDFFGFDLYAIREQLIAVSDTVSSVTEKIVAIYDALNHPMDLWFRFVSISGDSMEPTIHDGDVVLLGSAFYEPVNGDIIVFTPRTEERISYIKRVIATEGQTVDIRNGIVYVDRIPLEEKYIAQRIASEYPGQYPKVVPKDCVFVLGDNRNNSCDSRDSITVGMVDEASIIGKAYYRIFPLEEVGSLYWNYNLK